MDRGDQIDLASALPFRIGPMIAEPALRQVSTTTTSSETLQPRVMQVLVVLARANGAIVSRDALVRQCWEGRIVGDDSINRVISRLRRLSDDVGDGSFQIETITKVGYRLIGTVMQIDDGLPPSAVSVGSPNNSAATVVPRASRRIWIAGGAALAIVAGLAVALWHRPHEPTGRAVVVDTFTSSGAGMPATYAADLRNEMLANRTRTRPILTVLSGDAARYPAAFHLTGRLSAADGNLSVFPVLYAPGSEVPIWTPKYSVPLARAAEPIIGKRLMSTVACILSGTARTDTLPGLNRAAMEPFADYCEANNSDTFDTSRMIDDMRQVVAADPRFVDGWITLGVFLGREAWYAPPTDTATIRAEGRRDVATALQLDPLNSDAYAALAMLTTPTDYLGRDSYFRKAISLAPSEGNQKFQVYSNFMTTVGRVQDAILASRRSLQLEPFNPDGEWLIAEALATSGETGQAQNLLKGLAFEQSDHSAADGLRLDIAIWTRDWGAARPVLAALPDNPATRAMRPLIDALASGDKARIAAAGQPFTALATDPAPVTGLTISALALSGHDAQALAAVERYFHQRGPFALRHLYQPPFAHIRATPEFAALAERLRLVDYWRKSGHPPDFCLAAGAPPLCATLKPAR